MSAPTSPLIIGSTDSVTLQNAIEINNSLVTAPTYASRADRFWASGAAYGTNNTQEVLEINFASASLTNIIEFNAVQFPHTITLEYSSSTADQWQPVLDSITRQPVEVSINGSYPPILQDPSTIIGHYHPQHDYEGHWSHFQLTVTPVSIQRLRFILQRQPGGGPVNVSGQLIPYSLALQNIDTGYRIAAEQDIPFHLQEPGSDTSGQVFANSSDIFGSNLGFSKKTHSAANLALNTDDDAPLIWKSEPQPSPLAVVNFYADLRDAQGDPQIIDQIFIDPLYLGCSINLYYSNDADTGQFVSSRKGLTQSQAVLNGARISNSGPLDLGTWHVADGGKPSYFDPYFVQFDNFFLGFDPSIDWWIGFEWTRGWTINTDSADHDIFACDAFRIGQNQNSFYLSTTSGDTLTVDNFTADNQPIQVVAAYYGGRLHLSVQQGLEAVNTYDDLGNIISTTEVPHVETLDIHSSAPIASILPGQLLLGTDTSHSVFSGGLVTSFIVSQGTWQSDEFLADPSAYSLVPQMAVDENASKYDALLRFDTTQLTLSNSTGFSGGPAHPYDTMNWTPVPRTYTMQRGYMKVPVTRAKFWNLEISNLRPENNEKFVPVTRSVKFFPPYLFNNTPSITAATTRQTEDDLALNVLQEQGGGQFFTDIPQYQGTGAPLSGITNTEVYVAPDPSTATALAAVGSQWSYQQLHPDAYAPRFTQSGIHQYLVEQITQQTNVSYFAGLRNIVFSRSVHTAPQDAAVIEESFLDGDGVSSGNWISTDSGIYSGTTTGPSFAQAYSVVMPTQTGLRGLQFAAHQSDAQLIDIGGNFSDPSYDTALASEWSAYGNGKAFGLTYNQATDQYAFLVSRESDHGFWGDVALNWGSTYGALEASLVTYGTLSQGSSSNGPPDGGLDSPSISAPVGGTVYAAVRATASQTLTSPLYVQILDSDTETVLAEAQSNVSKNEVKQWFAEFDLDTLGATIGETWGELASNPVWPSFSDSFTRANASALGRMDSGQSWTTALGYSPMIISGDAAVGGTNARSEIDTGTPWGTMSIRFGAVATTTTHTSAVPLLDIGGIYLLNDGTFLDKNTSPNWGVLGETVSTSHDYNFKFMLTKEVPSGQIPSGVDASLQPYAVVITTGTLGSDSFLKTIASSRAITSLRALMGPSTTSYTKFNWVPTEEQSRLDTFIPNQINVTPSALTSADNNSFFYQSGSHKYQFQGEYTYGVNLLANRASSIRPNGSILAAPSGLTANALPSGGIFTSGTYYYKVTATNAFGETTASNEVSVTPVSGGEVSLTWTAVPNATNYNIYRGTTAGTETILGSSSTTSFTDSGDVTNTVGSPPVYNTTNGAGTMQITDVKDQYGAFRANVTQMPSNMSAADVILFYLDYDPTDGSVLTLRGNGAIWDEINDVSVGSISSFNPVAGPLSIHYVNTALLSSQFLTAHPQSNSTAILFYQNSVTYLGSYSASPTWKSTVRGIGGANNGTGGTQYTIIEGFNWNPDGTSLALNSSSPTWGNIDFNSTRTYEQMSSSQVGTSEHLTLRVVQKGESHDSWFIQSAVFFWDPVVWEFSCDSGSTWWEASEIRNDPNGVLLFPQGLTAYNGLVWRLTSYAGRVTVSHLAIRPWYVGQHGYVPPRPSHLPDGPNLIPYDDYAPIERDPRWMAWDKPVPHWWWNQGRITT